MSVQIVMVNELRKSLFRRKPVLAVLFAAIAILVLTLGIAVAGTSLSTIPVWYLPDLLLPIVAPAFAAGAFAKEYEQRTWQDILLTNLSPRELVGGKFFACMIPTTVTILVVLPPFALLLITQNVQWAMEPGFWMVVVGLRYFITAACYLMLGFVCSYHCKNVRTALVVAYVMVFLYTCLNTFVWRYIVTILYPEPRYGDVFSETTLGTKPYGSPGGSPFDPGGGHPGTVFHISNYEMLTMLQMAVLTLLLAIYLFRRMKTRRDISGA